MLRALSRPRAVAASFAAATVAMAGLTLAPGASADGPGVGSPWVVSVGDSYISGEAGRWAGNSNSSESVVDALGGDAYFDNATHTAEAIDRCHRSESAEVFLGTVNGYNLACSGAKTATVPSDSDGRFKPGLDFYNGAEGQGQALALQNFAATHNVKMVAVSIGGNDFNFGSIVQQCVTDFLGSPSWWKDYCKDDSVVTNAMASGNVSARRTDIKNALLNIRTAMRNAGYADTAWTLALQNYPSPLPNGSGIRYSESGYTRQSTGGCGFWSADADYANATLLPTINNAVSGAGTDTGMANIKKVDLSTAFNGRRLCETGVDLVENNYSNWTANGAVNKSEWIDQIRTVSTANSNYYIQESLHPNYWGQLALRNCLRQAYNAGVPKAGKCTISGTGLTNGEPKMILQ